MQPGIKKADHPPPCADDKAEKTDLQGGDSKGGNRTECRQCCSPADVPTENSELWALLRMLL